MPIYEYYCPACHMVLNFYSRTPEAERKPVCPHCNGRRLQRQVSLFSAGSGVGGDDEAMDAMPMDESRMERAMESLASDASSINEDDPKAAATLMRKLSKMTGIEFNEGIEHALQRMESGEDPEAIEAEMGSALDDADPFVLPGAKTKAMAKDAGRSRGAPRLDANLYDL